MTFTARAPKKPVVHSATGQPEGRREMSADVFLSHSTADKPAVEELARRLAQAGMQA